MALIGDHPRPANEAAGDVLDRCWNGDLPIRPERLALQMSVRLVGRDGSGDSAHGARGFFTDENDQPMIEFNVNDPLVDRRFALARELGRFVLGPANAPRDLKQCSHGDQPMEARSNEFAAELLMPARVVKTMAMSGHSSVDDLANIFGVSPGTMRARLANLII